MAKILIAEDERPISELVKRNLMLVGHTRRRLSTALVRWRWQGPSGSTFCAAGCDAAGLLRL